MDEKDIALRLARLREKKGVSARDMSLSALPESPLVRPMELAVAIYPVGKPPFASA